MTDLDWDSDHINCPSCGAKQGDLWEYDFGANEETEADCGSCGKTYTLHKSISVDYAASPSGSVGRDG